MGDLPDGIVTLLFTDVQGSTRAWEESPVSMAEALAQHDEAIMTAIAAHNGVPVKVRGEGDSWFIVFTSARDAVEGAADIQRNLATVDWVTSPGLVVRASLHTGIADLRLGDYYGPTVNRAARLRSIAHGGQTILSGATYQLVQDQLPDGVTVVDMGEHGLKDLTRPEHVYQLDIDDLPTTFPPLLSLNAVPNNLPVQLTDFIGRERELEDVTDLIHGNRLVTILAAGGSGKTRLAIQAAANLTNEFSDGIFFIGLADITTGSDIIQTIAETLSIGLSGDDDRTTQLLTYLTGKRQLLIFDNFEHIREEAPLVAEILKASKHITVLATSREKLNLSGETVYGLGGLETHWESPDEAAATSAVRLFMDGAQRTDPSFSLSTSDLDPLAKILQITDGLPLAILLASAWVDMLSLSEIEEEITKSLDFLETEMGDVPDRHRSIRAVFDYSWTLLSPQEQDTFGALSVFRGTFTRDGAKEVAGASLRGIANLVAKSLLLTDPTTGRYRVHALLRQYAEAALHEDTARCDEVQQAHADYFGALTQTALDLLTVSDQARMLDIIETDLDNIRTAWRYYLATADGAGAQRMITALYFAYEMRGWYPAAVELFDEALDAFTDATDEDSITARELSRAAKGWFMTLLGRADLGAAAAKEALDNLPDAATLTDRWAALQSYAIGTAYLGDSVSMVASLDESFGTYDALEDKLWVSGIKNWRSFAAILGGDLETAPQLLSEALIVYEQRDEHYFMTWALWLTAMVANMEGRPLDAIEIYSRQVDRSEEIGYLRGLVVAYEGLGDANTAAGQFGAADTALINSIQVAEQMGMVRDMLNMMTKVAKVRIAMGRDMEAARLLANICANPISDQQAWIETEPIKTLASRALDEVRSQTDPGDYATAVGQGQAMSFDAMVNQLLGRMAEPV